MGNCRFRAPNNNNSGRKRGFSTSSTDSRGSDRPPAKEGRGTATRRGSTASAYSRRTITSA